jgi:hypothetical protein
MINDAMLKKNLNIRVRKIELSHILTNMAMSKKGCEKSLLSKFIGG